MFDCHFQHRCQLRMAIRRAPQRANNGLIQLALQLLIVVVNFTAFWPIRRLIRRQSATHWVDPECEKLIESRMKRLQPKRTLRQQIPIEGFHVPNVKNNPMPLGDRPVVNRVFAYYAEQFVGAFAGIYKASVKVMPDADSASRGSHACFPSHLDAISGPTIRESSTFGRLSELLCSLPATPSVNLNEPEPSPYHSVSKCDIQH